MALVLMLTLLAMTPLTALAQASTQPAVAPSAGASAAGSVAPQPASAQASQAGPTVRALPTPVGGNITPPAQEPVSIFAWLLIGLAVLWFFAAMVGITRRMSRPRGMLASPLPPQESDRNYLSFLLPLAALVTVGIIVGIWGMLFLWTSHESELYPLAIDLFVVCFVMLIATLAALKGGGQPRAEVH